MRITNRTGQAHAPRQLDETMPLFSSDRERRLWLWTLAVVGVIYATLGMPSTLVGKLFERGLFDDTFFIAFLLIGVAILTQGLGTEV